MSKTGTVYTATFKSWRESIPPLLDAAKLANHLDEIKAETILIKPNLVEALAPPITTPVDLIEPLVQYLQTRTRAKIIIGEGSGAIDYETRHTFEKLGYTKMAKKLGIELIDLNEEKLIHLSNSECRKWPNMHLPKIALESFLISVPVLKAHSLAAVTLTMKNMIGLAPPAHFQQGGSWKKSAFHHNIQDAVADLNRYRTPDFTLLDATVGMAEAHLWGPTCEPPVNKLAAGYDPVAIDAYGSHLLDKNWQDIGHIRSLHGEIGLGDPLEIISL